MKITIKEGNYRKFGVSEEAGGYIFTFAGEKEEECFIRIYDKQNQLIERILVPKTYCMGSVRSVFVGGIKEKELRYNYEINGEIITDAYADKIIGREIFNNPDRALQDFAVYCGKERNNFDWEEDDLPEVPKKDMVMYKLHVRGFSMDGGAKGKKKGTFAAISDKIEYFKELGVTTLELMPIYEFEELFIEEKPGIPEYIKVQASKAKEQKELAEKAELAESAEKTKKTEKTETAPLEKIEEKAFDEGGKVVTGLNYWGYGEGNYFAVKAAYASTTSASTEFKALVKKLHQNGLECVMEISFPRGMNQNVIMDVLRFWVREYHVDGFHIMGPGVPVQAICQDMFLSRTKLFVESYSDDIYHMEKVYHNCYVYNDEYLYPARKLLNHQGGSLEDFANQQKKQHSRVGFVNYLASNNGFTLMDVFSYQEKHNEANGENNTDGSNWNYSANYGVEGKSGKRYVVETRKQQLLNAFAMLFFAQGVPLIMAGDEMCNTQNGNNNAYCQDNKIGWLNWKKDEKNTWLIQYVKKLIGFRKAHPVLAMEEPVRMNDYGRKGYPDVSYHGENAWLPGFYYQKNAYGTMYCGDYAKKEDGSNDDFIYVGYNFHSAVTHLALPKLPEKKQWYLVMDTSEVDGAFLAEEVCVENQHLMALAAQSVVVLVGK